MNRFAFTVQALLKKRKALKKLRSSPNGVKNSVLELSPEFLNENGIQVLVLDFDGVLAPHNGSVMLPEVVTWLKNLEANWPHAILIFSNKPTPAREAYFKEYFPKIGFLKDVARKPYPDGLITLQKISHVNPEAILMVDDRLLTGALAGLLAGCRAVWICKPYQNFAVHPLKEAWFYLLRLMDRILI